MDEQAWAFGIDGLTDAVEIGRGGFSVVYRARQPSFDRVVAVKVLNATPDTDSLARFEREVRAMGQLSEHPCIATVLDAGRTDSGQPYLLMPFLSGGSLADALADGTRFSAREAAEIGVKLASALQAAHDTDILHRDIKPANIMLGRFGDPLLVDFGIARIAGGHQTTTGVVTATLSHAAPELLDGRPATIASDVYALGSTLFTLVTGKPPFSDPSDQSVVPLISRIALQPLPPMVDEPEIEPVLQRAMAKDPADRHPTMEALRSELADIVAGRVAITSAVPEKPQDEAEPSAPSETRRVDSRPAMPAGPSSTAGTAGEDPPSTGRRHGVLIGAGVVAAVALIAVVVALSGGADDPDPAPADLSGQIDEGAPGDGAPGDDTGDAAGAGGVPRNGVDDQELARLDNPTPALSVTANSLFDLTLGTGRAVAVTFTAEEGQSLRFSTDAEDTIDLIVGLYLDDVLIAADDDGSDSSNVLLDVPRLQAGVYDLRLAALSGEGTVPASLQLPLTRSLTAPVEDALADVHDVHAYQVDVAPGGARGVQVTPLDGNDVSLRALAADGQVADSNSGFDMVTLDLTGAGPGTVVVFVAAPSGLLDYTIQPLTELQDALPPVNQAIDIASAPRPSQADRELEPSDSLGVTLERGEVLAVPIQVDRDGTAVRILARSPDGVIDPEAFLYGRDDALLGASDDEGAGVGGQDALIDQVLAAGAYVALFRDRGGEAVGSLDLLVAQIQPQPLVEGMSGEVQARDRPAVFTVAVRPGRPPPGVVAAVADGDVLLRLVAADGSVLASTQESGNPPLDLGRLAFGNYHLFVSAGEPGPFALQLG